MLTVRHSKQPLNECIKIRMSDGNKMLSAFNLNSLKNQVDKWYGHLFNTFRIRKVLFFLFILKHNVIVMRN